MKQQAVIVAVAILAALGGDVPVSADEGSSPPATDKVLATMQAAVEHSPEIALRTFRLAAEVAESRSTTGAGAPTVSWQREGIGSGLEQSANAADYLRFSLPFTPPWQRGVNRDMRGATDRLLETGELSHRLEVAAWAGRLWLDLAAETEMADVAVMRAERLARALATQTRRYELGEISGSERTQLELELARERGLVQQSETRRLAAKQQVATLTPGGFPLPVSGDLSRLVESTASASPSQVELEATLAQTASLRLAEIRGEVASVEARNQRHTVWGRPEVELEWERIPDLGTAPGLDAAGFRIAFPIPLGKEGRQKILAAEYRAEAAAAERDRFHRELEARLKSATETVHAAQTTLETLHGTTAQIAASEHSLAEQFRLGAISYVIYLDGLARLDEVRLGLITTRYSLLAARLELSRLLGTDTYFPLPALGREASQ